MEPIFNLKEGGGEGGGLSTSAWGREFVGMGLNHPAPENLKFILPTYLILKIQISSLPKVREAKAPPPHPLPRC